MRLLVAKFFGGLAALAVGMSLGREGPTIQMGAALGKLYGDTLRAPRRTRNALIAAGAIRSATPFDADQVQPASLDLRLGARAWRVRASFLPILAHLGLVLIGGLYMPAAMVAWFQNVAGLLK